MSASPRVPSPGAVVRRLLQNLGGGLRDLLLFPLTSRISREWVVLRLDRGLTEASTTSPRLEELMHRLPTLANVLDAVRYAHQDERVRGSAPFVVSLPNHLGHLAGPSTSSG